MALSLSKRHQARNEKALQELIRTVPGNDRCADCSARNPGWASWSLGIFLCMRCGAIHRKLGTHISKVKSLSMDSWSSDQVENMRKIGNTTSNKLFNPHNAKPKVPADADEIDGAMERFIRAKYEAKAYAEGAKPMRPVPVPTPTSNSRYSEEQPPTPPPKPTKRFGFGLHKSASALNLSRNKEKDTTRKASATGKIFGATIGVTDDGTQWKLTTLREMGFPDEKRNTSVLRGVNGDLERAIESLVRLGEGVPGAPTRSPLSSQFSGRGSTPPATEPPRFQPSGMGASLDKPTPPLPTAASSQQPTQTMSQPSSPRSNNPFDNIQPVAPPQPQPQMSLDSAMQNMNIGQMPFQQQQQQQWAQYQPQQVQQPLFPNATGGYTSQQDQQQLRLQQSMTPPPVPNVPTQFNYNNAYAQQQQQQQPQSQSQPQSFNPFLNNTQQVSQATPGTQFAPNPFLMQQPQFGASNPFMNQQTGNSMPLMSQQTGNSNSTMNQQPQFSQQAAFQQQRQQQQQPQHFQHQQPQQIVPQPWMNQPVQNSPTQFTPTQYFPTINDQQFANNQQNSAAFSGVYGQQYQAQQLMPQQTGRVDKQSILALYNYPQLAPQKPAQIPEEDSIEAASVTGSSPPARAAKLPPGVNPSQRSATMPVSGSKNPFARQSILKMDSPISDTNRHRPQESVSGRHSPDAFASLSARFVR